LRARAIDTGSNFRSLVENVSVLSRGAIIIYSAWTPLAPVGPHWRPVGLSSLVGSSWPSLAFVGSSWPLPSVGALWPRRPAFIAALQCCLGFTIGQLSFICTTPILVVGSLLLSLSLKGGRRCCRPCLFPKQALALRVLAVLIEGRWPALRSGAESGVAALGCPWLLLAVPGCPWLILLLAAPGCPWLLLAAPGCPWLLLAAPGCCWLLLAAPGCSWLLLAAPGCSWLLLAAPG
jgi:hypothetical protein